MVNMFIFSGLLASPIPLGVSCTDRLPDTRLSDTRLDSRRSSVLLQRPGSDIMLVNRVPGDNPAQSGVFTGFLS